MQENKYMLKVKTIEEGKSFEGHVKFFIKDDYDYLIALGVAGNLSTTRAIFASLFNYQNSYVTIEDDEKLHMLRTTRSYRRLEEVNGKVSHSFYLPRMAIERNVKLYHSLLQVFCKNVL